MNRYRSNAKRGNSKNFDLHNKILNRSIKRDIKNNQMKIKVFGEHGYLSVEDQTHEVKKEVIEKRIFEQVKTEEKKIEKPPVSSDETIVNSLYVNNYENYVYGSKEDTIPKIIHQIWLGGKIPDKYKRLGDTWVKKNPNWEYKLWGDNDVKNLDLVNRTLFDRANNLGIKSDILRYEILYKFGGLYADTDFECIKSFDDLIYLDFFTGTGYLPASEVYNGLIASKPEHTILLRLISNIKNKELFRLDVSYDEIFSIAGPHFFSRILFNYLYETGHTDEKIVIFPKAFFYAVPPNVRHLIKNLTIEDRRQAYKYIDKYKSYCLHYWCSSWQL